ncbi:Nn.00g053520.m01.CDS01 [Neocucurbitaria sp. VM-36]
MTSFKFPPPPPPPPKASSSNDGYQAYTSQRGGNNRGRGDGGRGRGGGQSRGGANQSFGGNARGGHGQANTRGAANSRGGTRGGPRGGPGGGYQNNRGGYQRGGSNMGYGQQQIQHSPPTNAPLLAPPARAYVNPSFVTQSQDGGQGQPQVDPNSLVQAMSFMATPAGQQSMAAFANHMASVGSAAPQYAQSPPPQHAQPAPRYSPTQHAGQKRKLNDRNNDTQSQVSSQQRPQQQSTKPPRAKAAVPPAVPSFGFSLPTPSVVRPLTVSKGKGKNDTKKRKLNLGLTEHPMPEESSEDEEIDEEARYSAKLKGGGFAFEHNGEQISIQTAAEVAAWVKDRKKRFPTQKRVMEKTQEAAMKRKSELEFLRKLNGRAPKPDTSPRKERPIKVRDESRQNKTKREEDGQRHDELAALRKKLHESMLEKQSKSSAVDLGLGYDSETASDEESSVLSESSVVSSSEESSDESDSESADSDEAPEPTSSKVGPPPIKVPPPAPPPASTQPKHGKRKICPNWEQHGRCSYSNKCKFAHPPKEEKRVGLYEMMVEQELVKADQLALDAIKYLGQHGFLG